MHKTVTKTGFHYESPSVNFEMDVDTYKIYIAVSATTYAVLNNMQGDWIGLDALYNRVCARDVSMTNIYAREKLYLLAGEYIKDDKGQNTQKVGQITITESGNGIRVQFGSKEGKLQMKRRFEWLLSLTKEEINGFESRGVLGHGNRSAFSNFRAWYSRRQAENDWIYYIGKVLKPNKRYKGEKG